MYAAKEDHLSKMYRAATIFIAVTLGLSCGVIFGASSQDEKLAIIKDHPRFEEILGQASHSGFSYSVNNTEKEVIWQGDHHQRDERLTKRYLNWYKNQIKSTTKDAVTVNYLRPHRRSAKVNINEDYLGFTLYKVNGREVESNTGIFHFVQSSECIARRSQCREDTLHAAAYLHIYGNCPRDDDNIVASGYCYRVGGIFKFNSGTFNDIQSYLDKTYYDPNHNNRHMNDIEIQYFLACFNQWRDVGFKSSFRCKVSSSFYVSSTFSYSNKTTKSSELIHSNCESCDVICNPHDIKYAHDDMYAHSTPIMLSSAVVVSWFVFGTLLINLG